MTPLSNEKTNIAWDKLYTKLEADGLTNQNYHKPRLTLNSPTIKWIASIAVLVICLSIFSYYNLREDNHFKRLQCTEQHSTLMVSLEDGSIIGLTNQSTIEYPENFSLEKREVKLKGNAFFDIAKSNRSFVIETEIAFVEVLGTAFCIESEKNDFSISIQKGKVKVIPKDGQPIIYAEKADRVSYHNGMLVKTKEANKEIFSNYFQNIHFKDQQLANIARMVNLNSDSTILNIEPDVATRTLTVEFSDNNVKQIANMIALALDLETKEDAHIITIFNKTENKQ